MVALRRWWWLSLALVAGLWLFVARSRSDTDSPQTWERPTETLREDGPTQEVLELIADPAGLPDSSLAEVASSETVVPERTPVPEPAHGAGDDAITVRGRVVFPPGTPEDERVTVLAREAPPWRGPLHRAVPDRAGRFEFAMARLADRAVIGIEGRYLHLDEGVVVTFDSIPTEVVLEPKLGGRIYGRIRLSEAARREGATVKRAVLRAEPSTGSSRRGRIADDQSFEIGGLPPAEYELHFEPLEGLVGCRLAGIAVGAGTSREIVLDTELGAGIRGRVIDEAGVPFASVQLRGTSDRNSSSVLSGTPLELRTTCDESGQFELRAIPPGTVSVDVSGPSMDPVSREVGFLSEGSVQSNFEIVAKRLGAIGGRVLWPDGRPAAGCRVRTLEGGMPEESSCDAEGRFQLEEFGDGSVDLLANIESEEGVMWSATARGVAAGTSDLEMRLRGCETLMVLVTDENRLPVPYAQLSIRGIRRSFEGTSGNAPAQWSAIDRPDWIGATELTGADGRTEVQLFEGEWDVEARATGLATSGRTLNVPEGPFEIQFRLAPEALIGGRVVDVTGEAVSGAFVMLDVPGEIRRTFGFPRRSDGRADAEGNFRLGGVEPGRYLLRAAGPGRVFSEGTPIDVRTGEQIGGLVLTIPPQPATAQPR